MINHCSHLHSDTQELKQINLKLASAIISGALDKNAVVQGLLAQCLMGLEKRSRGIASNRGRLPNQSATERSIIEEASLNLALLGANKRLAKSLGQNLTLPRVRVEDLPEQGLPNPMLALHSDHQEQLASNVELLDQLFHRSEQMPKRRLILAIDHTYLEPVLVQARVQGVAGTIGGPWSPNEENFCFVETGKLDREALKMGGATMMLECLCWDPNSQKKETYSLASMPMSLKRSKKIDMTLVKQGNRFSIIFIYGSFLYII